MEEFRNGINGIKYIYAFEVEYEKSNYIFAVCKEPVDDSAKAIAILAELPQAQSNKSAAKLYSAVKPCAERVRNILAKPKLSIPSRFAECKTELPGWWYEMLKRTREDHGTTYVDELLEYLCTNKTREKFPEYYKECLIDCVNMVYLTCEESKGLDENQRKAFPGFLVMDRETYGVYTIPSQRRILDPLIHKKYKDTKRRILDPLIHKKYKDTKRCILDPLIHKKYKDTKRYRYNKYLYIKDPPETEEQSGEATPTCQVTINKQIKSVNISIVYPDESIIKDFSLSKIISDTLGENCKRLDTAGYQICITRFWAKYCVFDGVADFDVKNENTFFVGEMLLCGSTFFKATIFKNIMFKISPTYHASSVTGILDLRNSSFFERVVIRNLSVSSPAQSLMISFEDARLRNGIEFINCDFGSSNLYLFQTVIGSFIRQVDEAEQPPENRLSFKLFNCNFNSNASFDCSDMEANHCDFVLEKIPFLPATNLSLSPIVNLNMDPKNKIENPQCPDNKLIIKNTEINGLIKISNFKQISFEGSHNYGKIVCSENWAPCDKGTRSSFGLWGQTIKNPLLQAVYNFTGAKSKDKSQRLKERAEKSKCFVMLKENFASLGDYSSEDVAFILSMEFKSDLEFYTHSVKNNSNIVKRFGLHVNRIVKRLIYGFLYTVGKYGISPGRVVMSIAALVAVTTLLYFVIACISPENSFNLANTFSGSWSYNDGKFANALLASLTYSLANVVPFVSGFEPIGTATVFLSVVENCFGSFFIGYFSVAVVKKTLRS